MALLEEIRDELMEVVGAAPHGFGEEGEKEVGEQVEDDTDVAEPAPFRRVSLVPIDGDPADDDGLVDQNPAAVDVKDSLPTELD